MDEQWRLWPTGQGQHSSERGQAAAPQGQEPPQERPRMTREGLRILVDEGDSTLQGWDREERGGRQLEPDLEYRRRLLREAVREGNDRLGRRAPTPAVPVDGEEGC